MDNLAVVLGDHGGEKERAKALARGLGTANRTLLAGRCWGSLPELLESLGCEVTGVVFGATARDEAQVACSAVEVFNARDRCFPEGLAPRSFDAIIFDDALEHFEEPSALLIDADRLLVEGGIIVAALPNIRFGAVRLALIKGLLPENGRRLSGFTTDGIGDLFVRAGYQVNQVARIRHAIFDRHPNLPNIQRSDFPGAVVAEIDSDPDAHIFEFIVHAKGFRKDSLGAPDMTDAEKPGFALSVARAAFDHQRAEMHAELERTAAITRANEVSQMLAAAEASVGEVWRRNEALETAFRESTSATDALRRRAEEMASRVESLQRSSQDQERIRLDLLKKTKEADEIWREKNVLQDHVAALKAEITTEQGRVSELRGVVDGAEARVAALELSQRLAQQLGETSQARVDELQAQAGLLEQQLNERRSLLAEADLRDAEHRALNAVLSARIAELEAERRTIREQLKVGRVAIDEVNLHLAVVENERKSAFERLAQLRAELSREQSSTGSLFAANSRMASQIADLEASLRSQQELYVQQLRAADVQLAAEDGERRSTLNLIDLLRAELSEGEATTESLRTVNSEMARQIAELEASLRSQQDLHGQQLSAAEAARSTAEDERTSTLDLIARLNAELSEGEASTASLRATNSEMTRQIVDLEASLASQQELHRHQLSAAEADLATAHGERKYACDLIDRLRAELSERDETTGSLRAINSEMAGQISDLEESLRQQQDLYVRKTSAAASHLASLQSENASLTWRLNGMLSDLELLRAREVQLRDDDEGTTARVADLEAALREAIEGSGELHRAMAEGRARFLDLEERTLHALEESEFSYLRAEEDWFVLYNELEETRLRIARLEGAAAEQTIDAAATSHALEVAELARHAEIRKQDQTRVDLLRNQELLTTTNDALRESRERAEGLAAEIAVLRVRAAQTGTIITDFERRIDDAAQRALRLESELTATRNAALAERIVMRDYADEIRSRGEEQTRLHLDQIARLTESVHHGARALDDLRTSSESNIQKLQAQIANVTAYGSEMRELLAAAERRLLDQTEDTIADMQAESAQLVLLIDTVQSSHFWKLKRWLSQLLRRNRR